MKAKSLLVILLSILSASCEREKELIEITSECKFHDNILTTCFSGDISTEYDEYIFRNNNSFQNYGDQSRINPININCDTAQLPNIDFSKFSLLTKITIGGGCNANYERTITKDTKNKKIIYQITATYNGHCYMQIINRNWVVTPKIPDDYTIVFNVDQSYNN
jgi:hypothetical protein